MEIFQPEESEIYMTPTGPLSIKFGILKDKQLTVEELPFYLGFPIVRNKRSQGYRSGFSYMKWLLDEKKAPFHILERIGLVFGRLRLKSPIINCNCCRSGKAEYFSVYGNESGISFGPDPNMWLFCEECHGRGVGEYQADLISTRLDSVYHFKYKGELEQFLEIHKYVFFGSWGVKVDSQIAFDYIFRDIPPLKSAIQPTLF